MCWGINCKKCGHRIYVKAGFCDGDTLICDKCGVNLYMSIHIEATYDEEYDEDE